MKKQNSKASERKLSAKKKLARDQLRDEVFWALTLLHSVLGTCDRLRTCSSAEKNKRLVGFGYNGSLPSQPHCDEVGHLMIDGHCERTRHGETNLRINTSPEDLRDSIVRVIATPCLPCMRDELISFGAREVYYSGIYQNAKGKEIIEELAKRSNVELVHCDIDWVSIFQKIFNRLSEPGGAFFNQGFKIKLIKESV
ncbi:MAG: Cytidine/deoxycytidylate deaminase family protein [Parcubacteria group bacterium GW2011_GWA2_43_13]|nr:MAG: Cytidine/deoxycytidylate deaminase family protein [Parcubacteria group bacterium GW2011_GWA2_43_13]